MSALKAGGSSAIPAVRGLDGQGGGTQEGGGRRQPLKGEITYLKAGGLPASPGKRFGRVSGAGAHRTGGWQPGTADAALCDPDCPIFTCAT